MMKSLNEHQCHILYQNRPFDTSLINVGDAILLIIADYIEPCFGIVTYAPHVTCDFIKVLYNFMFESLNPIIVVHEYHGRLSIFSK